MSPLLISLGAGVVIGLMYALLNVRSPAPPAIALVGLLGMIIGVQLTSALLEKGATASTAGASVTHSLALTPPVSLRPADKNTG